MIYCLKFGKFKKKKRKSSYGETIRTNILTYMNFFLSLCIKKYVLKPKFKT